jgi:glutathione synthase/RimK-type ligase-like ATP-grasp enzyme
MSSHLIIVEKKADWQPSFLDMQVITVKDYLVEPEYFTLQNAKLINLCRSYRYLSQGYYCSLLAEARHHRIIPTVRTLRDLSSKAIYSLNIESLDELLQQSFNNQHYLQPTDRLELVIFFGQCEFPALQKLAQQLFATFACPLLKVEFRHQKQWSIYAIRILQLNALIDRQYEFFIKALNTYTLRKTSIRKRRRVYRYDLAILHNPQETLPPSNINALRKFVEVGHKLDIDVDLITKKDYSRLAEYDALFIRETTAIEHYTYRFAKKAENENLVVIDDPDSILRCTNKVYLAELLKSHKVPAPKTVILYKGSAYTRRIEAELDYPVVLKIPDGAFSRGVFKAYNRQELTNKVGELFKTSDIILAQEYLYTPYDWRIGILNRKPLYACQYFMSDAHWQIVKHDTETGHYDEGRFRTFELTDVPEKVIKTALRSASYIGDGLYGVDLKETEQGIVVIEVNDNPNLDEGVENAVLKNELYAIILREFIRRIERKSRHFR